LFVVDVFHMTTVPEFRLPDELDEAVDWLSEAIRNPAFRMQFEASPRALALFAEKTAQILSALAKRDGEPGLSELLAEVAAKARIESQS
jgi:predicted transcriptional regulator